MKSTIVDEISSIIPYHGDDLGLLAKYTLVASKAMTLGVLIALGDSALAAAWIEALKADDSHTSWMESAQQRIKEGMDLR